MTIPLIVISSIVAYSIMVGVFVGIAKKLGIDGDSAVLFWPIVVPAVLAYYLVTKKPKKSLKGYEAKALKK